MLQNPIPRCQENSLQRQVNAFCRLVSSQLYPGKHHRVCRALYDDVSRGERSHIQGGGLGLERGVRMWGAWAQGA